jgi:hypothetical protein
MLNETNTAAGGGAQLSGCEGRGTNHQLIMPVWVGEVILEKRQLETIPTGV